MARTKKHTINPSDKDFTCIVICAVRYSLGRQTYMPGLVTGWIKRNLDGLLDKNDICVMRRDIKAYFKDYGTDADDKKQWDQVWRMFDEWLEEQEKKLTKT